MKKTAMFMLSSLLILGLVTNAGAAPTQWKMSDGGNDHWYEVLLTGNTNQQLVMDWTDARDSAFALGGYLATITSGDEENFVYFNLGINSNVDDYWFLDGADNWQGPWLGGYQSTGAPEPAQNWNWVTGEAWGYTHWASGEPNDAGPEGSPFCENDHEQYLQFFAHLNGPEPRWNDITIDSPVKAYVVEYNSVPIPSTILLLGTGLIGLVGANRKRK